MLFLCTVLSLPSYLMFSNGPKPKDVEVVAAGNATRRLLSGSSLAFKAGGSQNSDFNKSELIYSSAENFKRYLQGGDAGPQAKFDQIVGGLDNLNVQDILFEYSLGNIGQSFRSCNATNYT